MKMSKWCTRLLICIFLMVAVTAKGEEASFFTDSAGRQVKLPATILRIAPSGQLAQIVLYSLCPDKLIGWAATPSSALVPYLPEHRRDLPVFGQFYGKNMSLNLEALIAAKPDVIIDIGERKATIREDMDSIAQQTGIPVIFIEATLDTMPAAYERLGKLTGTEKEASALSQYAKETVAEAARLRQMIDADKQVHVYYAQGNDGLATDPTGSIHADVIDLVGAVNVADIAMDSGSGMNPVSMEQVLLWQPDVVLFAKSEAYEAAINDPLWLQLKAEKECRFYDIPGAPYNWLGRPPAVNRLLGIKWLGNLLYPDVFLYDMTAEVQKFFRLFYHWELRLEEARELMENSTCLTR